MNDSENTPAVKTKGVSKPAMQRILRTANIKRINTGTYDLLRTILNDFISTILFDALVFTQYDRRKMVKVIDLKAALENRGLQLGAAINEKSKTKPLRGCSPNKKKHSNVKKIIIYRQNHSDCLVIPHANFVRLTKHLLATNEHLGYFTESKKWNVRFEKGALLLFQLCAEVFLIRLCKNANLIATRIGRETLYPQDVTLARDLSQNKSN